MLDKPTGDIDGPFFWQSNALWGWINTYEDWFSAIALMKTLEKDRTYIEEARVSPAFTGNKGPKFGHGVECSGDETLTDYSALLNLKLVECWEDFD